MAINFIYAIVPKLCMTTIALTDEIRAKLGLVNKYNNFVKNSNESLGETIGKLCDKEIEDKKIKIPQQ